MKVAVTGANGNLGRRLIRHLRASADVVAIVRSIRAQQTLMEEFGDALKTAVVDYDDADGLTGALRRM
ncbi:MAG: hypothetical protein U5O39_14135 [Gammaproteobacteria bacterium]|nr:hypothetical protein [Gammaproteobacteria bacterium]